MEGTQNLYRKRQSPYFEHVGTDVRTGAHWRNERSPSLTNKPFRLFRTKQDTKKPTGCRNGGYPPTPATPLIRQQPQP